ncbi:MAG TPA: right-handed parallel beta-helix repeat-containing protein, partial [Sphingomonas sp.]
EGATGTIARNMFVQGPRKENGSAMVVVGAEAKTYRSAGLRIEGNEAVLAAGATSRPAFVVDFSHERLAIGRNRLGAGVRGFELR